MLGFYSLAEAALATAGIDQPVSVTGVQGTTALGTATETGTANVYLTGVQGTTALGTATASGAANVTLTGVQAQT